MGTHPIFESDFDCLTEMSLAELAKRHREKGGNKSVTDRNSGDKSRLTLGDAKKKKSGASNGSLSLSDLLNKKKSTDQSNLSKKPILSNLKNLIGTKSTTDSESESSDKNKPTIKSKPHSIIQIEEKVDKLSIQDTTRSQLAIRSSRLSTALAWPKGATRKRKFQNDQSKDEPIKIHSLDFNSQVSLFDEDDHFNFFEKSKIKRFEITKYLFDFETPSPDAKVLDC